MLILKLNSSVQQLMRDNRVTVENLEPKKDGVMFTFNVDDPGSDDTTILRVMFKDIEPSDKDFDFSDARLIDLSIYEHRSAYGSHYFVGRSAVFNKQAADGTTRRAIVKGSRIG